MYKIISFLLFLSFFIPLDINASNNIIVETDHIDKKPFKFEIIPLEVQMVIIDCFDFNDIKNFREVSKYYFDVSKLWQGKIDASKKILSNEEIKSSEFEKLYKILQHFTNITAISLRRNNIQGHLKKLILALTTKDETRKYGYEDFYLSQNLRYLNLFNCGINDPSCVSSFFKQNHEHTLILHIEGNEFKSFGEDFCKSLINANIKELHFNANSLELKSLRNLIGNINRTNTTYLSFPNDIYKLNELFKVATNDNVRCLIRMNLYDISKELIETDKYYINNINVHPNNQAILTFHLFANSVDLKEHYNHLKKLISNKDVSPDYQAALAIHFLKKGVTLKKHYNHLKSLFTNKDIKPDLRAILTFHLLANSVDLKEHYNHLKKLITNINVHPNIQAGLAINFLKKGVDLTDLYDHLKSLITNKDVTPNIQFALAIYFLQEGVDLKKHYNHLKSLITNKDVNLNNQAYLSLYLLKKGFDLTELYDHLKKLITNKDVNPDNQGALAYYLLANSVDLTELYDHLKSLIINQNMHPNNQGGLAIYLLKKVVDLKKHYNHLKSLIINQNMHPNNQAYLSLYLLKNSVDLKEYYNHLKSLITNKDVNPNIQIDLSGLLLKRG